MTDTIPRLLRNTGCQDMLALGDVTHSGWLRKRTRFHRKFHFSFVTKLVPWFQKYVVLTKGCAYIYKNENSTSPCEAFILRNFSRVQRAVEFRHSVVPWAFRVEHRTQDSKFRYFSCSSQHEMKLWMIQFKKEMYTANVPELMSRRTKIAELERAKTKLSDTSDSDVDSGLYVYIESELSAEGAIQRTSSLTSVYDGDRCSTQPPEPPTRPTDPMKPNVWPKPRSHHEDASDPIANTTVKSLGSDECNLYDDPSEDVPYDDCGNVSRSLWNDALWTGSKEAGDRVIGCTSQSSSSLSGRAAEAEAVGWGRRVANSLRRPDNTLSVTRSTRASSLVGVVLLPASALDVAVAVAARRSKTAPGRLERLEVHSRSDGRRSLSNPLQRRCSPDRSPGPSSHKEVMQI